MIGDRAVRPVLRAGTRAMRGMVRGVLAHIAIKSPASTSPRAHTTVVPEA